MGYKHKQSYIQNNFVYVCIPLCTNYVVIKFIICITIIFSYKVIIINYICFFTSNSSIRFSYLYIIIITISLCSIFFINTFNFYSWLTNLFSAIFSINIIFNWYFSYNTMLCSFKISINCLFNFYFIIFIYYYINIIWIYFIWC